MDLLFERFLSEERGEWPDIDLDLPSGDQRERVIQYLYKLYGERGAAMTANVITYRSRLASREMGKALGFDPETLDKVSAAVSTWEYRDENDTFDHRFRDAGLDINHPRLRKYFELCSMPTTNILADTGVSMDIPATSSCVRPPAARRRLPALRK